MTGAGASITEAAPPMAHAIGGSLGSALALLMLYPLERARVELQTQVSRATSSFGTEDDICGNHELPQHHWLEETDVVLHPSRGGSLEDPIATMQEQEEEEEEEGAGGTLALLEPFETAHMTSSTLTGEDEEDDGDSDERWESCISTIRQKSSPPVVLIPPAAVAALQKSSRNSNADDESASLGPSVSTFASTTDQKPLQSSSQLRRRQQQQQQSTGLISCLLQLQERREMYRGVTPVVITMAVSNYVFYYLHSYLKQLLLRTQRPNGRSSSVMLSLIASSLAGIANVLLTNPLWVANLRLVTAGHQQQNTNNLWQELHSIWKYEGWQQLWNGTPASLLLVSNPVIQFVSYEQLKQVLLSRGRQRGLTPLEAFLLGALAKTLSTIVTYPLQLAQTVLRVQKQKNNNVLEAAQQLQQQQEELEDGKHTNNSVAATPHPPQRLPLLGSTTSARSTSSYQHYKGTLDCLIQLYQQQGIAKGLFAGMSTKLLQTVLTAAFTFLTYEQILRVVVLVHAAMVRRGVMRGLRSAATATP